MFVRLENTPRDYAWGSATAIASLLGYEPTGLPEAELWLGTHPGSPARILDPQQVGGFLSLDQWIAAAPEETLGASLAKSRGELPFLLKLLAAAHPLSLQSHPSLSQAREGFARENAAGVPLSAVTRNYKDPNHKPELIVALSDIFDALCGFRVLAETLFIFRALHHRTVALGQSVPALAAFIAELSVRSERGDDAAALRWAVSWLLRGDQDPGSVEQKGVQQLVGEVTAVAALLATLLAATVAASPEESEVVPVAIETILLLSSEYPGDPGVVVALLLNRVRLSRGEALYLPAGNMHAYLTGFGVELMASSDNVLRGGLTAKHIDVDELVAVTVFASTPVPYLTAQDRGQGVMEYSPGISDFELLHVRADETRNGGQPIIELAGPAIVICTAGTVEFSGALSRVTLRRGEFLFVTPDEQCLGINGSGEIFVAKEGIGPARDE